MAYPTVNVDTIPMCEDAIKKQSESNSRTNYERNPILTNLPLIYHPMA